MRTKTNLRRGATLLEVLIVVAVVAVLFLFAFTAVNNSLRIVQLEGTDLEMGRSANRALGEIATALRPAILPIPIAGSDAALSDFARDVLNSSTQGFDGPNGQFWRDALRVGTDCIAFAVPVEQNNSILDADGFPKLGILIGGVPEVSAAYTGDGRLAGHVHPALAALNPAALGVTRTRADVDPAAPRFADNLAFPAGARGYAVIRFVPYRRDGQVVILREDDFDGGLSFDFNQDGDRTDSFLLGRIEIAYPPDPARPNAVRREIITSGQTVLLQMNANDPGWTPLFQLVRYRPGEASANADAFNSAAVGGDYAIRISLLMCDNLGQQDPASFREQLPGMVRRFETNVQLRNMATMSGER